jgi:hypothetical protein
MPEVYRGWNNSFETRHTPGNAVETGHALNIVETYAPGNVVETGHALSQPDKFR